ncbi:hypothetical protein GCM10012275_54300 [Longimycelium tulufanense]|uniref:Thiopeptide-type bacteriocin biosynthesis domain-containing protein n=1 Tax=Longimycelium tulufanense TaxID=907463 RepID=A0A8J3CH71_9PSEU|nr:thiopeptide-type bacteriocin biosynthesis protein [Longimycelium tulufanense]GGM76760.1 hypothetical protein GCM10012275_54300 [Longimycelium tulufanense]
MAHDPVAPLADTAWRQVVIRFPNYTTAEHVAAAHLGPELAHAEDTGLMTAWFFTRKKPHWRLRFLPTTPDEQDATKVIHTRLDALRDAGHIEQWVETIYEPETYAFGGPAAMEVAHRLFHADSHHILHWLHTEQTTHSKDGRDHRRELSILLYSGLLRSAALDWYERGDVWTRVAEHRPPPPHDTPRDHLRHLESQVRTLMTVDTSPTSPVFREGGPFADMAAWLAAFTQAGRDIRELADTGRLTRGLRAVLAHHLLFAWNRLGLPSKTQGLLAHAATNVVFGEPQKEATRR